MVRKVGKGAVSFLKKRPIDIPNSTLGKGTRIQKPTPSQLRQFVKKEKRKSGSPNK